MTCTLCGRTGHHTAAKCPWAKKAIFALLMTATVAFAAPHRSHAAKVEFAKSTPCPATGQTKPSCKGYVIDHIKPLACGGPDAASNMQWQSVADGKSKDKWERKGC